AWFQRSVAYIWRVLEREKPQGYLDAVHWITFLQYTPEQERAKAYWCKVDECLLRPGMIVLDPDAEGYVQKVLDWAPDKDSYARRFVPDAEIRGHLRALV